MFLDAQRKVQELEAQLAAESLLRAQAEDAKVSHALVDLLLRLKFVSGV